MSSTERISFTYNQAIDLVTKELENTKIGQDAGTNITGERNIILGKDTAFNCIDINDSIIIGYRQGFNLIESSFNIIHIINNGIGGDETLISDNNSIMIGSLVGKKLIYNNNNNIIGFNCINNIESNINNNIIYGSYIGNELIECFNNTIVGNNNLNETLSAINNIYMGNSNINYDFYQYNSLIIGNNNIISENPLIIGNSNIFNTSHSIGIGNKLSSYNILKAVNYLNIYDPILNNNIIDSLKLSNLNVNPINNNFIYNSPHNPIELSLNNNLNYKQLNIKLDTFNNIKLENDTTYIYDIEYNFENVLENNIYKFNEPLIINTNFTTNYINFEYIDMKPNFKIYISELPKYNHISKNLYDFNETIILEPYLEYLNVIEDNFIVYIVINIKDNLYLSKEFYNIRVIRDNIINNFIPKEIYGNYISFDWFNELNINKYDSVILLNDQQIDINNFILTSSNVIWDNDHFDFNTTIDHLIVNGNRININQNDIIINNIIDLYDTNIDTEWYMFSSNIFYIGDYNIFGDYIYIDIPPKYGIINTNIIKITDNFINFQYIIVKDIEDEISIRILNEDKTKISNSFKIKLKNYTINKNNELSTSLINDLYYVDNNIIKNPNNSLLLEYINYCNINYIDDVIDYDKQIDTKIIENEIIIDIYPFNKINIYNELIHYGFCNIEESNIFILNENIENGYIIGKDYINSTNDNDNIKILIALNRFNYDINNVYTIVFNVINNYIFEYTTQYIYEPTELLKTFNVINHPKNNIYIYDGIEVIQLDHKYINSNFNNFKVLFGNSIENLNIEYYPVVNNFEVLYNSYWFKQIFSIEEINKEHSIEYIFKEGINNFKISFDIFISLYEEFNIAKFKKYKFHIILNDQDYIYDENSILKYNENNVIIIDNNLIEVLYKFKIVYKLSENIYNETENISNYFLAINFNNLIVEYKIDKGKNILYGQDIQCFGYQNIGFGSLYNLYGNNSIVIGNKIGNDFINNSIILGNDSFLDVIPRNVISIGNNNYNNIENTLLFDELCSKNPIIIGHNLEFNSNHIININNVIIETDDNIIIGNNDKKLIVSNINIYYSDIKDPPKIYSNYNDLDGLPNLELYLTSNIIGNCNFAYQTDFDKCLKIDNINDMIDNYNIVTNDVLNNYINYDDFYKILNNCNFATNDDIVLLNKRLMNQDILIKSLINKIDSYNIKIITSRL
tara:strand:- start:301 stop:3891 length:3591 start_codon:yes stop_codon:yes gene_type:complete